MLEIEFFPWLQILSIFPSSFSLYSFPRNSLPNTQIWVTIVCQLFFQLKVIFHKRSGKVSSQFNSHYHQASVMAEVLYAYISLHHTIWKGCWLKSQSLIKLTIFTAASSKTLLNETGQVTLFCMCVCVCCEYVVVENTMITSMIWCTHLNSSWGVSVYFTHHCFGIINVNVKEWKGQITSWC